MMAYYTDDPVADFVRYDAEQQGRLEKRPKCADCGEHIQDETAVYINGRWICDSCLEDCRREVEEG